MIEIRCEERRTLNNRETLAFETVEEEPRVAVPQNFFQQVKLNASGYARSCCTDRIFGVTAGDRLRHSKFVGLREEKNLRSVVKEHVGEAASD